MDRFTQWGKEKSIEWGLMCDNFFVERMLIVRRKKKTKISLTKKKFIYAIRGNVFTTSLRRFIRKELERDMRIYNDKPRKLFFMALMLLSKEGSLNVKRKKLFWLPHPKKISNCEGSRFLCVSLTVNLLNQLKAIIKYIFMLPLKRKKPT